MYVTAYGVQHCKRELGISGWFRSMLFVVLSSLIVGFGYAVCCIGFRCHIIRVMLTGVGGNAEVERGHAVYGCTVTHTTNSYNMYNI